MQWFFLGKYCIWACWNNVPRSPEVAQRCSVNKVFLEISQYSQKNICARVSFSIKLQAKANNFIEKETPTQMFCCEFCEILKNIFSYRTPPVAASERDWLHQSSFRRLCVARMLTNLNINDNDNNNKKRVRQERDAWREEMFYSQNSFHKRTLKFSRKLKNYMPKICQFFPKVEVAT